MTFETTAEQSEKAPCNSSENWSQRISGLREEIGKLTRLLSELESEEADAQEQLRSLTYAADLTRGEAKRRARAINELSSAYTTSSSEEDEEQLEEEVHRLEGELLNAKRDSANVMFDVEQLEFRLKRLREQTANLKSVSSSPLDKAVSPTSPSLRSSPQLTSLSSGNSGSVKISPLMRGSRLIGDVDAVVRFVNDEEKDQVLQYAPCRIGVGASGHIALHSYDGAAPLVYLDDSSASLEKLSDEEAQNLSKMLDSVDLYMAGNTYRLCGLEESIAASMQLVKDAGQLLQADEEEIKPQQ